MFLPGFIPIPVVTGYPGDIFLFTIWVFSFELQEYLGMIPNRLLKSLAFVACLSVSQFGAAQVEVTDSMNQIFSLAESKLSEFFPPGAQTGFQDQYVYRFYEATGVYLAFGEGNVYLLGGAFGEAIVEAGSISFVLNTLDAYTAPIDTGGVDLWNLTISGTVNTGFVSVGFDQITLNDIPAPDLNDTEEINQEIVNSLEGIATGLTSIQISVVNNSENQRTFDVTFSATVQGVLTYSYNLRYDYTR